MSLSIFVVADEKEVFYFPWSIYAERAQKSSLSLKHNQFQVIL